MMAVQVSNRSFSSTETLGRLRNFLGQISAVSLMENQLSMSRGVSVQSGSNSARTWTKPGVPQLDRPVMCICLHVFTLFFPQANDYVHHIFQVWSVRVDLHVLDNGGNIADCASIAAITALAHFRYVRNYIQKTYLVVTDNCIIIIILLQR